MNGLTAVCALARWSTQAAAVSVATVADDHLRYVAADGVGAAAIVGTRLPAGRGIAGFVAATGQSITVREPASDPRFARDTAESTGYVPASIQCVPVEDAAGDVVAVVSVLDRTANPLGPGVPGVPLERVTELVAALLAAEATGDVGEGAAVAELDARLTRLAHDDRTRALTAFGAILDALER